MTKAAVGEPTAVGEHHVQVGMPAQELTAVCTKPIAPGVTSLRSKAAAR
ncbi:MAG: hypothetical protein ACRDHY_14045 [Anaerolineales bacterium]